MVSPCSNYLNNHRDLDVGERIKIGSTIGIRHRSHMNTMKKGSAERLLLYLPLSTALNEDGLFGFLIFPPHHPKNFLALGA